MNRRSFLASILAAGTAPAFIGSSVLMPVRRIWTPAIVTLDGMTAAERQLMWALNRRFAEQY